MYAVSAALSHGKLRRAEACELCGDENGYIIAHHWRGYDDPLDVWWICRSCNTKLIGQHNGISREEAREYIARRAIRRIITAKVSPEVHAKLLELAGDRSLTDLATEIIEDFVSRMA